MSHLVTVDVSQLRATEFIRSFNESISDIKDIYVGTTNSLGTKLLCAHLNKKYPTTTFVVKCYRHEGCNRYMVCCDFENQKEFNKFKLVESIFKESP